MMGWGGLSLWRILAILISPKGSFVVELMKTFRLCSFVRIGRQNCMKSMNRINFQDSALPSSLEILWVLGRVNMKAS